MTNKINKSEISKVAYIVVGWNNKSLLEISLRSAISQIGVEKVVYYIDNASADGSVDYVKKSYPTVELIINKNNLGFAKANNLGITMAIEWGADFVVLINSDAEIEKGWSKKIIQFSKKYPQGACFQGLTLRKNELDTIDSRGLYLDNNFIATQIDFMNKRKDKYDSAEVFGVNAAAAMYTTEFLKRQPFGNQYFDEDFFMYLEDVDLSLRAIEMGYSNYFVSGAIAWHVGSASSSGLSFAFELSMRNNIAMLVKNFPLKFIFKYIPKIIRSDISRVNEFYIAGKKDVCMAIIKGRLKGILFSLKMLKKRKRIVKYCKYNIGKIISFMDAGYIRIDK